MSKTLTVGKLFVLSITSPDELMRAVESSCRGIGQPLHDYK